MSFGFFYCFVESCYARGKIDDFITDAQVWYLDRYNILRSNGGTVVGRFNVNNRLKFKVFTWSNNVSWGENRIKSKVIFFVHLQESVTLCD